MYINIYPMALTMAIVTSTFENVQMGKFSYKIFF